MNFGLGALVGGHVPDAPNSHSACPIDGNKTVPKCRWFPSHTLNAGGSLRIR